MDAGVFATNNSEIIIQLSQEKTVIAQKLKEAIKAGDDYKAGKYRFHLKRVSEALQSQIARA